MSVRAAGFVIYRRLAGQIEYLLLKASYGTKHWSPPKGHVDPGEDDYTTALRELKEEAGFSESDLQIYKEHTMTLEYQVKNAPKSVIYWLAELKDLNKDTQLSEEHTEFKWLPKEEAKTLCGFQDFKNLIDFFHTKIE